LKFKKKWISKKLKEKEDFKKRDLSRKELRSKDKEKLKFGNKREKEKS
jgi:hypothetical protein